MQPDQLTVRYASAKDVEALQVLYQQLIPDERPDTEAMRQCLAAIENDGTGAVVVADVGGKIVGTCQIVVYDNPVRTPQKKGIVDSVVVDEPYRQRGIGTRMVSWGVEELKRRHCRIITVSVSSHRETAPRLYAKVGFQPFGSTFLIHHDD